MLAYGAPDGHGRFGIVDTDKDGLLICHECGAAWKHLATHARAAHGLVAATYREKHGLGRSRRLVAPVTSDKMRESWEKQADLHLAALDSSGDPDAARSRSPIGHKGNRGMSRPEVLAGYQQRGRARRGRSLTEEEALTLGDGLDLQAWADAARVLLTRDGVSAGSLAEAADIAVPTVHQRLRRYPDQ